MEQSIHFNVNHEVLVWARVSLALNRAQTSESTGISPTEYNTSFLNARKQVEGKEEADPYLIGYCKVHNCTLLASESKTKNNKIPAVTEKNGVRCIDINDFHIERGLRMERKK